MRGTRRHITTKAIENIRQNLQQFQVIPARQTQVGTQPASQINRGQSFPELSLLRPYGRTTKTYPVRQTDGHRSLYLERVGLRKTQIVKEGEMILERVVRHKLFSKFNNDWRKYYRMHSIKPIGRTQPIRSKYN